ncbi:expressed unknown protein [Seminavis robusta]|uniref:Uncharacterized protein n=1 Tax=Seminavis robusta TaxID=568900 RepID=A0A9N8H545_9STRA|nr:expressed unknown protein [Seminavis robusta]|eukprot:Sro103_g052400.1 n/a (553) ;mRNA; f:33626-35284
MVLLPLTRKLNKALGPFLLRNGLRLRMALGSPGDNPTLDSLTGITWAQKLISIEAHHDAQAFMDHIQKIKHSPIEVWVEDTFDRIFGKDDLEERRKTMTPSEIRLSILESYLRPALLPDERWSNVLQWRFHTRLLKWIRAEWLLAQYGLHVQQAVRDFPKFRHSPQLTVTSSRSSQQGNILTSLLLTTTTSTEYDPQQSASKNKAITASLPTTDFVHRVLETRRWSPHKNNPAVYQQLQQLCQTIAKNGRMVSLRGGGLLLADLPLDTPLQTVPFQDVLQVLGGHVHACGPLNALCEERDMYQLWTQEYVDRLAHYLLQRCNRQPQHETVILDIGAGDGLLGRHLQIAMGKRLLTSSRRNKKNNNKTKAPTVVSVDNGSWRIHPRAAVEPLSVEQALEQYVAPGKQQQHTIVLCSWMPMGVDWSHLFRQYHVDEYILIGECDDGTCGDNWDTWGNPAYQSDEVMEQELMAALVEDQTDDDNNNDNNSGSHDKEEEEGHMATEGTLPQYQVDGYKRIDKDDWAPFQFSRFDSAISKTGKTVVFRRTQKTEEIQ